MEKESQFIAMLSLVKDSKDSHQKAGEKLFCVSVLKLFEYPQNSATLKKKKWKKKTI